MGDTVAARALSALMVVLAAVVLTATALNELRQGFPGYGVSEWLISYDAGFVRRGLWGTVIHAAVDATGLSPVLLAVALSLAPASRWRSCSGSSPAGCCPRPWC